MFDFLDKIKYESRTFFKRTIRNTRIFFCKHYYVNVSDHWLFGYARCKKCGRVKLKEPYMTIHEK